MIEVEKKALINNNTWEKIISDNKEDIRIFAEAKKLILIKSDDSTFQLNKKPKIDLKLRTSKNDALMTIKTGTWQLNSPRKEFEFHFDKKEISSILEIFKLFGYKYYFMMYINKEKYLLKDLIITIEKYKNADQLIISIEVLVDFEHEISEGMKRVSDFLKEYGIAEKSQEEVTYYTNQLISSENNQINFEKVEVADWEKDSLKLISCCEEIL
jgi:adenylate cyclase class IV